MKVPLVFESEDLSQSTDKLRQLFAPLRLEEIANARIATLSKGERKRLLLALALLTSQPLLLLDEPFDGLDLRQTRDVMEMLRGNARARCCLFSFANQSLLESSCWVRQFSSLA